MNKLFPSPPSRRNLAILLVISVLVTVILITKQSRNAGLVSWNGAEQNRQQGSAPQQGNATDENPAPARSEAKAVSTDSSAPVTENASPLSQAAQKRTIVTASGVRKQLIDPMSSWSELPAWPEGPQLFAEVETADKRFVNLRPDDVGEMPRVLAGAAEEINITISIPEGEPGEKIFLELPNGGSFKDSESRGRVLTLSADRKLTFSYITDRVQGYCNVKLRHRGHTRSLPVWVGELPATTPEP